MVKGENAELHNISLPQHFQKSSCSESVNVMTVLLTVMKQV